MRAAVFHGRRDVRVEEVAAPELVAPDAVRLRVHRAALCGSDAAEYQSGPHAIPLSTPHPANRHVGPTIMGHEFVGTVIEVGKDLDPSLVGSRVVSGAGVWCGACRHCRGGRPNLCALYYTVGLEAHGGLAEEVVVPARTCVLVPDEVPNEAAATAQPLAVAVHALARGRVTPEDAIAVVGVGGIGALVVAAAQARGVSTLIAVDTDPGRLRSARSLGATHEFLAGDRHDLVEELRAATGGEGPDVVLETAGRQAALDVAVAACRRGGRVVAVGTHGERPAVDMRAVTYRELELLGTVAHICERDLREAVALLAAFAPLRTLARRVISIDDVVGEGLAPLAAGEAREKIVVAVEPAAG
jgi:(R,R)-butanediol dehydrogenase/meso-butanediol dehydrogenase/diacetyl reductase